MAPDLIRPRQRGFTLIEIIVVVLIIGIVLALAVVNLQPGSSQHVQQESERLALVFEAARDEAIASGTQLGWSVSGHQYGFWRRQGGDWQPVNDDDSLRARQLPDDVMLDAISVNLQPLPPDAKILFTPSGVNELFSLRLSSGETAYKLSSDVLGRIKVEQEVARAP
ncbi:type II secretion system minor pseudopilin GspH [Chitinivorax sp. PXF-14]|uniref:type II secretion system minor pseudopilin GspH n=1 Tax=Chitinivorax sp. PXF-14 TaxID=3230488 RepID=UPI003466DE6A